MIENSNIAFSHHDSDPQQTCRASEHVSTTIYKKYNNHDWRSTFGTQLKESGLTSAQVADMLGHSDTRMVETVYAPMRKAGVLKNAAAVEDLNKKFMQSE